jgi:hypothetical protein
MSSNLVSIDDLVTVDEIAKRLHWSVNTTLNIAQGRDGRYKLKFPRPLVGPAKRGVWLWTDVLAWVVETTPKAAAGRHLASSSGAETSYRNDSMRGKRSA